MISMVWYFDDYCLVLESWSYRNKRKLPPKIRRRLEKAMGYIRILNKLQVSHYSFLESVLFGESYVRNFHEDRIIEHDLVPVIERLSHSNEFGKFEATILYYEFLIDKGVADRQRAFFNLMSCFIEHVKKKKKNEKKELLSFQDLRCMWEFSYGCLVKKYTKDVSLRGEGSVPVFIEQVLHALFNFMINCDFPREYVCRALDGIIYYSSDEAKEQIYQLFDRWWLEYIGS
ncbi:hypothetical protein [Endozoicomonas sp. Mp262]|uniref:hypothetical protein n=1 Tax=Endozoicomonas sp. Mp262 TaxID=2919499 RepID=UPI0021DA651F